MVLKSIGFILIIGANSAFGEEMDVLLRDRTSSIIVSRNSGTVVQKLVRVNQVVEKGDELIILNDGERRISVISNSSGLLKQYSKDIVSGNRIDKGDVIAEILSHKLSGVLYSKANLEESKSIKLEHTYCCLFIGDNAHTVKVKAQNLLNGQVAYSFSIIEDKDVSSVDVEGKLKANAPVRFELKKEIRLNPTK